MTQRPTFRHPVANRRTARRGISLMEVLISAFIIAVGLLGVAALLPVGHHEANLGTMTDRAAMIGRAAFRDFHVRGQMPGRKSMAQIVLAATNAGVTLEAYVNTFGEYPDVLEFPPPPLVPNAIDRDLRLRYRSNDDPRYTWCVWAGREPYASAQGNGRPADLASLTRTNRTQFGTDLTEDVDQNIMLNYVPPVIPPNPNPNGGIQPLDSGALVKVVVFVFFNEDDPRPGEPDYLTRRRQLLFDPGDPETCPPKNRPIAVFEKVMTIEGTSSWNN